MSRNPFLSTFEAEFNKEASKDLVDMSATMKDSPKKATFGTAAEELFVRVAPAPTRASLLPMPALSHRMHPRCTQEKNTSVLRSSDSSRTRHAQIPALREPVC